MNAARRKPLWSFQLQKRVSMHCEQKMHVPQQKKMRAWLPLNKGKQALCFTSGSFAQNHFQLHHININLFSAFGAIQREIDQHSICENSGPCFSSTNRAPNPSWLFSIFTHKITSSVAFALRSIVWLISGRYEFWRVRHWDLTRTLQNSSQGILPILHFELALLISRRIRWRYYFPVPLSLIADE